MIKSVLQEYLAPSHNKMVAEAEVNSDGKKSLYMKGIFIQGGVRNANGRVYPVDEIKNAVEQIKGQIESGNSVLGELDHPDDLKINLDRVSHVIQDMWLDGPTGYGKLKILPTPMGQLVSTMLESGVKLGVSSRGSGNVNEATGHVSGFDIVTVDIVAQPSAPNAYPKAVYESLINMKHGHKVLENLKGAHLDKDAQVQRYLQESMLKLIKEMKIK